jgi:hypothetical protein
MDTELHGDIREEVKNVKFSWDGEYIAAAGDDRCIDIVSRVFQLIVIEADPIVSDRCRQRRGQRCIEYQRKERLLVSLGRLRVIHFVSLRRDRDHRMSGIMYICRYISL